MRRAVPAVNRVGHDATTPAAVNKGKRTPPTTDDPPAPTNTTATASYATLGRHGHRPGGTRHHAAAGRQEQGESQPSVRSGLLLWGGKA
jgi:hypothetical protein